MLAVHGSIDHRVCQPGSCCQLLSVLEAHLLPEAMSGCSSAYRLYRIARWPAPTMMAVICLLIVSLFLSFEWISDSNFVSSISFCAEIVKVKEHDISSRTMTKGRIIASLWILCNNHTQKQENLLCVLYQKMLQFQKEHDMLLSKEKPLVGSVRAERRLWKHGDLPRPIP